ncbi:hypothetical protein ACJ41O_010953 [Fusarium nematophilum]
MCKVVFNRYWCKECSRLNHFTKHEEPCADYDANKPGQCRQDIVGREKSVDEQDCEFCKEEKAKKQEQEQKQKK